MIRKLSLLLIIILFISGCGGGAGSLEGSTYTGAGLILNTVSEDDYINSDPNDAYKYPPIVVVTPSGQTQEITIFSFDEKPKDPPPGYKVIWVNGYTRKDGKYVRGYWRTLPDGIKENNLGKIGFHTWDN